jgi:hypothetical protein
LPKFLSSHPTTRHPFHLHSLTTTSSYPSKIGKLSVSGRAVAAAARRTTTCPCNPTSAAFRRLALQPKSHRTSRPHLRRRSCLRPRRRHPRYDCGHKSICGRRRRRHGSDARLTSLPRSIDGSIKPCVDGLLSHTAHAAAKPTSNTLHSKWDRYMLSPCSTAAAGQPQFVCSRVVRGYLVRHGAAGQFRVF